MTTNSPRIVSATTHSAENARWKNWSCGNGMTPAFADVFSGLGGFHFGFHQAGAACVTAAEIDERARQTYRHNFSGSCPSIFAENERLFVRDVFTMLQGSHDEIPQFDILAGGFPCQPFSLAGKKQGFHDEKNRGALFRELVRLLHLRGPIAFFLENVRHIMAHDMGRTWTVIKRAIEALGYVLFADVVKGTDYGIPQIRQRVFMIGLRRDAFPQDQSGRIQVPFVFPHRKHPVPLAFSLNDVLGGQCPRSSAFTIRCSGQGNRHGERHCWDSYDVIIDGIPQVIKLTTDMGARLMGLPNTFSFPESISKTQRFRQLGNSVIVPAVEAVARALIHHVETHALPNAQANIHRDLDDLGYQSIFEEARSLPVEGDVFQPEPSVDGVVDHHPRSLIRQKDTAMTRELSINAANDNDPVSASPTKKAQSAYEIFQKRVGILVKSFWRRLLRQQQAGQAQVQAATPTRGRRCTVAHYKHGTSVAVVIRLCPMAAAAFGLKAGDIVSVAQNGSGYLISPADKGVMIVKEKSGLLLIRKSGMGGNAMKAKPVTLSRDPSGVLVSVDTAVPVQAKMTVNHTVIHPTSYASLTCGKAGKSRMTLLTANSNVAMSMATTAAGDECYTPRFLLDIILGAAMRKEFDADFCSMLSNGRYDLLLHQTVLNKGAVRHPDKSGRMLQVIGHVPAKTYYTKACAKYGSLQIPWNVDLGWLNPPYTRRLWAVFLEKAAEEVKTGRAKIIVALVPKDDTGPHISHLLEENAYRIELCRPLPFFMKSKTDKNGKIIRSNSIEFIRGNQLVIFGKGKRTGEFLSRLVDSLEEIGYITDVQAKHYRDIYYWHPRLKDAA